MRIMQRLLMVSVVVVAVALTPNALAQSSGDLGKNWRVYNRVFTPKLWDITQPEPLSSGLLQFPVQPFVSVSSGSFVIYLLNNYNVNITNKTLTAGLWWTDGLYKTRSSCSGAYVRFEFQDVTAGPYDSNDYWWSTGDTPLALDLNGGDNFGTLTASLTDRAHWLNQSGKLATDTTEDWIEWTGATVHMSPYDGFTKAMQKVKQIGLSFGSSCAYASGIAIDGTTAGTFQVNNFTISP